MSRRLFRRGAAPRHVGIAVLLVALGCATNERGRSAAAGWPPRGPEGGNRPISDLDADADGRIGTADAAAFAAIVEAAAARLLASGIDPSPAAGYYRGPPSDQPPVFTLVRAPADVAKLPADRLRELYVEARWLVLQARLALGRRPTSDATVGGMLADAVPGYDEVEMEPRAVCAAALRVDASAYTRAGMVPTALFDVDSTLWAGNGSDAFLAALIDLELPRRASNVPLAAFLATVPGVDREAVARNGVLANAALLLRHATDPGLPEEQRISAKDSFYNLVALLAGVNVAEARAAARRAVHVGTRAFPAWKSRLFADRDGCSMTELVASLRARGIEVYLLSATPDLLVEEAARLFGLPAGRALGSVLEIEHGRYTGRVRDNPYDAKGPLTRQWLAAPPLLAFGDSPGSDLPMLLEATGAGFMVNPRPAFFDRDRSEARSRLVAVTFDGIDAELARVP